MDLIQLHLTKQYFQPYFSYSLFALEYVLLSYTCNEEMILYKPALYFDWNIYYAHHKYASYDFPHIVVSSFENWTCIKNNLLRWFHLILYVYPRYLLNSLYIQEYGNTPEYTCTYKRHKKIRKIRIGRFVLAVNICVNVNVYLFRTDL